MSTEVMAYASSQKPGGASALRLDAVSVNLRGLGRYGEARNSVSGGPGSLTREQENSYGRGGSDYGLGNETFGEGHLQAHGVSQKDAYGQQEYHGHQGHGEGH
ncbi:hypothetical protein [Streptomyces sp. CB03238]|uniref:hypothetical protein n=1 Tax=Streptomyces sp. CB03238 TaxID=1907777 RepID=UPI00117D849D|nr:hypothetical protein [Streptomyces sp. CB03238]